MKSLFKTLRLPPLFGALLLVAAVPLDAVQAQEDRPTMTAEVTLDVSGVSETNTVLQNVQAIPELSSLASAIERAGLADALSGPGPFTVFAPIDDAFDLADKEPHEVEGDDLERLAFVLRYHVAEGEMEAGDLSDGMTLVMLNGEEAAVTTSAADPLSLHIDDANIIHTDIASSNGVLHLINLVLNPTEGGTVDPN